MPYAIAISPIGPVFGEVVSSNYETGRLRLRHPLLLVERPGSVKDASGERYTIEREFAPLVGSVGLPDVIFDPPWSIVEDAKLAKMHEDFARRMSTSITLVR